MPPLAVRFILNHFRQSNAAIELTNDNKIQTLECRRKLKLIFYLSSKKSVLDSLNILAPLYLHPTRWYHSQNFAPVFAQNNNFKCSFFPHTTDWNHLPHQISESGSVLRRTEHFCEVWLWSCTIMCRIFAYYFVPPLLLLPFSVMFSVLYQPHHLCWGHSWHSVFFITNSSTDPAVSTANRRTASPHGGLARRHFMLPRAVHVNGKEGPLPGREAQNGPFSAHPQCLPPPSGAL